MQGKRIIFNAKTGEEIEELYEFTPKEITEIKGIDFAKVAKGMKELGKDVETTIVSAAEPIIEA